jgi:ABC-type phosphate transport system substrate-binding protein
MPSPRPTRLHFDPRLIRGRRAFVCAGLWLSLAAALLSESTAEAESAAPTHVVIVHPKSATTSISREALGDIFLKKAARWPSGEPALPVDQKSGTVVREVFSRAILRRSTAAVRSYWMQRIFSGREVPPPELDGDGAVVNYVASHLGAVGYVSTSANISTVKPLVVR